MYVLQVLRDAGLSAKPVEPKPVEPKPVSSEKQVDDEAAGDYDTVYGMDD